MHYYLIVNYHCGGVITDYDATGGVAVDAIFLNFGETAARNNNASSLIFVNVILRYVCGAIEKHNAIVAIVDSVTLDP